MTADAQICAFLATFGQDDPRLRQTASETPAGHTGNRRPMRRAAAVRRSPRQPACCARPPSRAARSRWRSRRGRARTFSRKQVEPIAEAAGHDACATQTPRSATASTASASHSLRHPLRPMHHGDPAHAEAEQQRRPKPTPEECRRAPSSLLHHEFDAPVLRLARPRLSLPATGWVLPWPIGVKRLAGEPARTR